MMGNYEDEVVYSGRLLNFFLIAYQEFSTIETALLNNFKVCFIEDESKIKVTFSPKFAPGEIVLGGRTSLGRAISYIISKEDLKIIKKHYSR